jgi:hypothetical protein
MTEIQCCALKKRSCLLGAAHISCLIYVHPKIVKSYKYPARSNSRRIARFNGATSLFIDR